MCLAYEAKVTQYPTQKNKYMKTYTITKVKQNTITTTVKSCKDSHEEELVKANIAALRRAGYVVTYVVT